VIGAIVETDALLQVIAGAFAAGVGVIVTFSLAVAGAVRSVDMRRAGRPAEAAFFGVVATAGLLICAAAVVAGIIVMAQK